MTLSPLDMLAIKAELAKRDLKTFIKEFWSVTEPATPFIDGLHIDAVCDHLTNIDDIGNLLICMPPGFAKSLLVSVHFFCWRWLHKPHERFIFGSHSAGIAIRDSRKCRDIIRSQKYQAYYADLFKITEDQDTKARFDNDKTGFRLVSSVDGGVTGERADFVIADDAHNVKDIESKAKREAVLEWYSKAFSNRVVPQKHQRIVVMQMAHAEDLANTIIKNDVANRWTKLIIPLEAGKSKFHSSRWVDPRQPGELLCPALFSRDSIELQRQESGSRAFSAQYNQNPAPIEDALFKLDDLRYYDTLPEGGFRLAAVDLAISLTGDYTVIAIADVHRDGSIFLVHLHRERMEGPKIIPKIKAMWEEFQPRIIYVEDVAFQRLVIQEARQQGIPVKPIRPEGDKVSRSFTLRLKLENGKFFLPNGKPYLKDIQDEMEEFPNAPHDDIVDALSYIALEGNIMSKRVPSPEQVETPEERNKRINDEFAKRVKEDEERMRQAFFNGLR